MQLLNSYKSAKCNIFVYDTQQTFFNESIYCITSRNRNNDKILIRFGTKQQIESLLKTYATGDFRL